MESLNLIKNDPWLAPYESAIEGRYQYVIDKEKSLTNNGKQTLSEMASGYLYFGLHKTAKGWIFREWAPNATAIYLIGTFNDWQKNEKYKLKKKANGVWEISLAEKLLCHGDLFKLLVEWDGGSGERIPAWIRRVVQDPETKIFSAQVWNPEVPYKFKNRKFKPKKSPLLIYECHIGMSTNEEKVGSYDEFRQNVLPRVAKDGYNAIQIMAIQEHPYYGSFGYHVSSFFAASSRFGTPEDLKRLIDEAHGLGISVIMDIVHSHAVKNEIEGLGRFDGSYSQYFHQGDRREHPAWDSLCFDYGKNEVLHFLLSNCKFWNKLIHEVNPNAITIAEEVSGMPGLAAKIEDGGYGFDYRMAMNIPDFWIKTIKEKKDEDWHPSEIWWETTNRRADEKTISYAESHDQALVGDKTIIFRLIDADMYWHMQKDDHNFMVERGIALHKMIRLVTASTINGGYLNFMGNEFGHPEWIDFPREGNGWSYKYARRQWDLVDNKDLKYHYLGDFDQAMLKVICGVRNFQDTPIQKVWDNDGDQILAYMRKDLVFVFNFSPTKSFTDYGFLVPKGEYEVVLNTDAPQFGGFGLADDSVRHFTQFDPLYKKEKKEWLKIYIPARSAVVLRKVKLKK